MKENFYKNYMKKIYIIFLICICFFFLSSCSNSEDTMIEDSYTETEKNLYYFFNLYLFFFLVFMK